MSAHSIRFRPIRFRRGGGLHVVRPLLRQAFTHEAGDEIGSSRELFERFIEFVLNKVDFLGLELALQLSGDGGELTYVYDSQSERTGITRLFKALEAEDIRFSDLQTKQSSLEDIFVGLVSGRK